ncbi:helix-turn-helix domain-containing protein [Niveispirillum cyanobacteriorum]|nr:helix-turn-helix domain-containing protein [Niveispirillum cyanobacteriorum]
MKTTPEMVPANPLGLLLRAARKRRHLSQMTLALEARVSPRHLNFVETGRSRPSRQLLMALLDVLEASPSERNAALLHAGFTGSHSSAPRGRGGERQALTHLVYGHDPFPALVFDANWTILEMNRAGAWLAALVMPDYIGRARTAGTGLDMIDAVADAQGLLSMAHGPERAAAALLAQFEAESWAQHRLRSRVERCAAALRDRYGTLPDTQGSDPHRIEIAFATSVGMLAFSKVQCILALPQDVTVSSPRAELWVPMDSFTRRTLIETAEASPENN